MLYDIKLHLHYDYAAAAGGGRHQVRVMPQTIAGVQRVIAASLSFQPPPAERADFSDFFGNSVTSIARSSGTPISSSTRRSKRSFWPSSARC